MAEPGNTAMMRDALRRISLALWSMIDPGCNDDCCAPKRALVRLADAALAAPARNCDVGTAEEQVENFDNYCRGFGRKGGCGSCPASKMSKFDNGGNSCFAFWSQMPFPPAEGGSK